MVVPERSQGIFAEFLSLNQIFQTHDSGAVVLAYFHMQARDVGKTWAKR
jgi:hypothetical protein